MNVFTLIKIKWNYHQIDIMYPLVNISNNYWKWPFLMCLPGKNGGCSCVSLPEGTISWKPEWWYSSVWWNSVTPNHPRHEWPWLHIERTIERTRHDWGTLARGSIHFPWEDAEHERNAGPGRRGDVWCLAFFAKSLRSPNFAGQRNIECFFLHLFTLLFFLFFCVHVTQYKVMIGCVCVQI